MMSDIEKTTDDFGYFEKQYLRSLCAKCKKNPKSVLSLTCKSCEPTIKPRTTHYTAPEWLQMQSMEKHFTTNPKDY